MRLFIEFTTAHLKEIDNFFPLSKEGKEACLFIKSLIQPSKKHHIEYRNDGQLIEHLRSLFSQKKITPDIFAGAMEVAKIAMAGYKNEKGEYLMWYETVPDEVLIKSADKASRISLNQQYSPFHEWTISEEGDIKHEQPTYCIDSDRLHETDWLQHMVDVGWVDLNDFVPLYLQALSKKGYKLKIEKK